MRKYAIASVLFLIPLFTGCDQPLVYLSGEDIRSGTLNGSVVQSESTVRSNVDALSRVSLSPDGSLVAYVADDPWSVTVVDVASGSVVDEYTVPDLRSELDGETIPDGTGTGFEGDWFIGPMLVRWSPTSDDTLLVAGQLTTGELTGFSSFLLDRSSGSVELLPDFMGTDFYANPSAAWSPDGTEIAYSDGDSIWALDLATGSSSTLVEGRDPAWGTGGLAFIRSDNLYVQDGGSVTQATSTSDRDRHPVWIASSVVGFIREDDSTGDAAIWQSVDPHSPGNEVEVSTDQDVDSFDVSED